MSKINNKLCNSFKNNKKKNNKKKKCRNFNRKLTNKHKKRLKK